MRRIVGGVCETSLLLAMLVCGLAYADKKPPGKSDKPKALAAKAIPMGTYEASEAVKAVLTRDNRVYSEAYENRIVVDVDKNGGLRFSAHYHSDSRDCWSFGVGIVSVRDLESTPKKTVWTVIGRTMNTTDPTVLAAMTPCGGLGGIAQMNGANLEFRTGGGDLFLTLKRVPKQTEVPPTGFFCATASGDPTLGTCARAQAVCERSKELLAKEAEWTPCAPADVAHCFGWDGRATIYRCAPSAESCIAQRQAVRIPPTEMTDTCSEWR